MYFSAKLTTMKILRTKTTLNDLPLKYLKVLNGTLKLTEKELELTAALVKKYMYFGSQGLKEPFLSKFVFSTDERRSLCESLNSLSVQNLGNKFQQLVDKGVLVKDETGYSLLHSLLPQEEVTFKFIIIDDEPGETLQESSGDEGSE